MSSKLQNKVNLGIERKEMKIKKKKLVLRHNGGGGLLANSCLTLPTPCSPPGSSVHVSFWARILECVAISYSRGYS